MNVPSFERILGDDQVVIPSYRHLDGLIDRETSVDQSDAAVGAPPAFDDTLIPGAARAADDVDAGDRPRARRGGEVPLPCRSRGSSGLDVLRRPDWPSSRAPRRPGEPYFVGRTTRRLERVSAFSSPFSGGRLGQIGLHLTPSRASGGDGGSSGVALKKLLASWEATGSGPQPPDAALTAVSPAEGRSPRTSGNEDPKPEPQDVGMTLFICGNSSRLKLLELHESAQSVSGA
jgi:hypothetical protein